MRRRVSAAAKALTLSSLRLITSPALTVSPGCLQRRQPHKRHKIARQVAVCPPRNVSRVRATADTDQERDNGRVLTRFMCSDPHLQHSKPTSQTYKSRQTPGDPPTADASTKRPHLTAPTVPADPIMDQSTSDTSYPQPEAIAGPSSAPAPASRSKARLDTPQLHTQPPMRKVHKVAGGKRNNTHNGSLITPAQRAAFLARFTYADMRDTSSNIMGPLLPKIPSPYETGVIFHAPNAPGVDYTLIRKATHDFLDFDATFAIYPTYCLLPIAMKPNKGDWDDTRDTEQDEARKVRCLFCRARFGGRNAKAMWERHSREHWDKGGKQI